MLHIILTILKILGIILLVLLGLILLIFVFAMLAPFRYSIRVTKTEKSLKTTAIRIGVRWLQGLVAVRVVFREMKLEFTLRIFGRRIKKIMLPGEEDEEAPSEGSKSSGQKKAVKKSKSGGRKSGSEDTNKTKTVIPKDPKPDEDIADELEDLSEDIAEELEDLSEDVSDEIEDLGEEIFDSDNPGEANYAEDVDSILEKLEFTLEGMGEVPEKLIDKIEGIREKIRPFLESSTEIVRAKIVAYVKYLVRHYSIRKASGYLNFGTGKPDLTGQLAGLIYVILPPNSKKFRMKPDFYERHLECDVMVSGKIRAIHLMRAAVGLLLDKDFRNIVKTLLKGG